MHPHIARETLYNAVLAYDGDDFQGWITAELDNNYSPSSLAIPKEYYKVSTIEEWQAFESFLIDHQDEHICTDCGCSCSIKIIDDGIGEYEFWGQVCYDSHKCEVSTCCEGALA